MSKSRAQHAVTRGTAEAKRSRLIPWGPCGVPDVDKRTVVRGALSSEWGLAGPDVRWRRPVGRSDATGVEEAAEPIVVEPSEPVAGAFHFLDDQIQAFGWPVGNRMT